MLLLMTFEYNLNIYVHVAKGSVFGMILSEVRAYQGGNYR